MIEGGWLVPYDKKTRVETTQRGVEIFQTLQQKPANYLFHVNPKISKVFISKERKSKFDVSPVSNETDDL